MGSFGGFFKGEKKKKRKGQEGSSMGFSPTFVPPEITGKNKKQDR